MGLFRKNKGTPLKELERYHGKRVSYVVEREAQRKMLSEEQAEYLLIVKSLWWCVTDTRFSGAVPTA